MASGGLFLEPQREPTVVALASRVLKTQVLVERNCLMRLMTLEVGRMLAPQLLVKPWKTLPMPRALSMGRSYGRNPSSSVATSYSEVDAPLR